MASPELSGMSVVGAGSFNPAIFHPLWLAEKELISEAAAEDAMSQEQSQQMVVTPDFSVFVADWLSVRVTQDQAIFATVDTARELDLRDIARGVFELLPETPIDAIGINVDAHFSTGSAEAWHSFGDRFLPKPFWETAFGSGDWEKRPDGAYVGMRVMTVEVHRDDGSVPGWVRVELAPSVRVMPYGVYIGINSHFQLKADVKRGNAGRASRILIDHWDTTRALESRLITEIQKTL